MRKHKYALTHTQFEELRQKLAQRNGAERFEEANVEAAFLVMVKEQPVLKVAEASKMSRQNLHRVVRDLWAIFNDVEPPSRARKRQDITPRSWVRVAVTLPPDMAKSVQDLEAEAHARLQKTKDSGKD